MPYDLCEDEQTLDCLETAMASRGECTPARLPGQQGAGCGGWCAGGGALSLLPRRHHPGQHRAGPGLARAACAGGHPEPAAGGGRPQCPPGPRRHAGEDGATRDAGRGGCCRPNQGRDSGAGGLPAATHRRGQRVRRGGCPAAGTRGQPEHQGPRRLGATARSGLLGPGERLRGGGAGQAPRLRRLHQPGLAGPQVHLVELLVAHGADLNGKSLMEETPLGEPGAASSRCRARAGGRAPVTLWPLLLRRVRGRGGAGQAAGAETQARRAPARPGPPAFSAASTHL